MQLYSVHWIIIANNEYYCNNYLYWTQSCSRGDNISCFLMFL